MSYELITWTEATEITSTRMQKYPTSIDWRHKRISYPFDLSGDMIEYSGGVATIEGYLPVNPYTYPGYAGAGAHFGQFRVNLPEGLFEELLYFRAQPATADNGAMSASISGEGPGGVTVFVWDSGGRPITGFALWILAIGRLKAGVLP
jgi:hypothetical protein